MKKLKKISLVVILITMLGTLTGCTDYMYKKGDVTINMDEEGKGYIEQSFAVKEELLGFTGSKLGWKVVLKLLSLDVVDKDLGIDADYDMSNGEEVIATYRLEFDSYEDFNNKINAIIDKVNSTKADYKIYNAGFGIRVENMNAVVASKLNSLLDEYNIKYDMSSLEYRYMIEKMLEDCEFNPNVTLDSVQDSISTEIKIKKLNYFDCEGNEIYKKAESYIKEGNQSVDVLVANILEIYAMDLVATNLDKFIDEDVINAQIEKELIDNYVTYVCTNINKEFIETKFVANQITDLSQLTIEKIDDIEWYTGVCLKNYLYNESTLEGYCYHFVESLNKLMSDDYYCSNNECRVLLNGKEVEVTSASNEDTYNNSNLKESDNKVIKATLENDETPATFDSFPLMVAFVIVFLATVSCVVFYWVRKRV